MHAFVILVDEVGFADFQQADACDRQRAVAGPQQKAVQRSFRADLKRLAREVRS